MSQSSNPKSGRISPTNFKKEASIDQKRSAESVGSTTLTPRPTRASGRKKSFKFSMVVIKKLERDGVRFKKNSTGSVYVNLGLRTVLRTGSTAP